MIIRPARREDAQAIAGIILPTIRAGETYTLDPGMSDDAALAYWMGADKETFVAEEGGVVLGTYYIRPNQAGPGAVGCFDVGATDVEGKERCVKDHEGPSGSRLSPNSSSIRRYGKPWVGQEGSKGGLLPWN